MRTLEQEALIALRDEGWGPKVVSRRDAAEILGVAVRTVERYHRRGILRRTAESEGYHRRTYYLLDDVARQLVVLSRR